MPITGQLLPGIRQLPTGYDVANSVRFNGSNTYMTRTMGTPTNADKFSFSFWVKRSKLSAQQSIFRSTNGNNDSHVTFRSGDTLDFQEYGGLSTIGEIETNQVFRDVSAWYSILLVWDSGNSTAGNRMRMYVNGTEVTSFGTDSNPSQNADSFFNKSGEPLHFGRTDYSGGANYFSGYVCEMVMCDGQALVPSDIGEFDSDSPNIFKPIDVSGLTFGNNGFYLNFEDSSDLGKDVSGNGNHFTESNFSATDQSTDTCTNNAITMNPLDDVASSTYSEGNLKVVTSASGSAPHFTTFGLTTGKWYWEVKATSFTEHADGYITIGITGNQGNSTTNQLGHLANDYAFVNNGQIQANTGNDTDYGSTYTQGQIIGTYLDLDNNKLYFSINGSLQNSGTGHSITAASSTTPGFYMPSFSDYSSSSSNLVTVEWNFGAGTTFAISSGNSDDNGYGNFEYSPNITGDGVAKKFYTINSKNLAEFG
jgi:hypothetical protein